MYFDGLVEMVHINKQGLEGAGAITNACDFYFASSEQEKKKDKDS